MKKSLLRVYLLEDEVLRKVGLNNTFKTLLVSESLTMSEMKVGMLKKMVNGMTAQETTEVNRHVSRIYIPKRECSREREREKGESACVGGGVGVGALLW
jgi:hypothetical protein